MSLNDPDPSSATLLENLTGRGIRVAIIDTGIDATHPSIGAIYGGVHLVSTETGTPAELEDYGDTFGHGTACAAIVLKIAPECELLSVKISKETEAISPELLVAAIDWAVEHGADVINVSVGTTATRFIDPLRECCRRAVDAGVVVIAAESNDGQVTYPAALEPVITVGGAGEDRKLHAFHSDPRLERRFIAYGGHQKIAWTKPRFIFMGGNSFAVARISGIAALIVEQYGRLPNAGVLRILHQNSFNGGQMDWSDEAAVALSPELDIGKAVLFPFSKEMHSLVRFRHLLPFELVGITDHIMKGCVGKDAGELIGLPPIGLTIESNLEEALARADTLILGFMSNLQQLRKQDPTGAKLARRAIDLGKNVYSFEEFELPRNEDLLLEAARRNLHVAWPSVENIHLEELERDIRHPVSYDRLPVLGVFGTSRSQGKFTLQLLLREKLRELGLTVGQIGTEHQSPLFGMDDCFPIGHISNVHLDGYKWKKYFNLRYQQIMRDRDPDILIIGAQGGLTHYSRSDPFSHIDLLVNIHLLTIINADSFILVINHLDPPEVIENALALLRIIGKGEPILLALSTQKKHFVESFGRRLLTVTDVNADEQTRYLCRLEERFGLPAISILEDDGIERMLEVILRNYSAEWE